MFRAKRDGFEYCEFWTWKDRNWGDEKSPIVNSGIKIAAFSGDDEYSLVNPDENSLYVDFIKGSIEKGQGNSLQLSRDSLRCPE